jgi:hypothetical protein
LQLLTALLAQSDYFSSTKTRLTHQLVLPGCAMPDTVSARSRVLAPTQTPFRLVLMHHVLSCAQIVYRNGQPVVWYFTAKDGTVKKKA